METITIQDWGEFVANIAECTQIHGNTGLWWRGQSVSEWDLIPSLYRGSQYEYEQTLVNTFMNKGKCRHPSTPTHDDYVGWLFLMQHYRLPTRLLDWTLSP
ncbi:MAG: FRG domain-containing protein, partial [Chloroflexota bacterium]|nr:FRG domain-containing protein [Chloroflexota bacterium]